MLFVFLLQTSARREPIWLIHPSGFWNLWPKKCTNNIDQRPLSARLDFFNPSYSFLANSQPFPSQLWGPSLGSGLRSVHCYASDGTDSLTQSNLQFLSFCTTEKLAQGPNSDQESNTTKLPHPHLPHPCILPRIEISGLTPWSQCWGVVSASECLVTMPSI